jgi:hypothetical protein
VCEDAVIAPTIHPEAAHSSGPIMQDVRNGEFA